MEVLFELIPLDYAGLSAVAVGAIKEPSEKNDTLEEQIALQMELINDFRSAVDNRHTARRRIQ